MGNYPCDCGSEGPTRRAVRLVNGHWQYWSMNGCEWRNFISAERFTADTPLRAVKRGAYGDIMTKFAVRLSYDDTWAEPENGVLL